MDDFYAHHQAGDEHDPTGHWIELDRNKGMEPWWLHEALTDSGIPFIADVEVDTYRRATEVFNVVYIPPQYEVQARALIEAYNNPENFVLDEHPETAQPLELLECAQCGQEFDAEYGACPFCFPGEAMPAEANPLWGFRMILDPELEAPEAESEEQP